MVALAAVGLLLAYPVATLVAHALTPDAWRWLANPYVLSTLRISLVQAVLSTTLALGIGGWVAWHHHRHQVPFGRVQRALHFLPFVMPVFVVVFGLQAVLGPWLRAVGPFMARPFGVDPNLAAPLGAVVLANAYYNYGLAARLLYAALERRPRRLEEAAATLGAPPAQVLSRITWPTLSPAVLGTALLVFLFTFGAFGTVLLLGDGKVRTLETLLYSQLGVFGDFSRAATLGLLQLLLNAALLGVYVLVRRRGLRLQPEPQPKQPSRGVGSWLLTAAALAPIAFVLVGGFRIRGAWSLAAWNNLMTHPDGFDLPTVVTRTVLYALATAFLALLLTGLVAQGRRASPVARWAEVAAGLPAAVSSLLIGLALLAAFSSPWLPLADTPWILIIAHTLVAFPFAARVLLPALEAHDHVLDEAATTLGASRFEVLRRVQWPMLRHPILVAASTSAALSLADFGSTLVLSVHGTRPLTAWILALDGAFDPVRHARAVLLAGVLAVLAIAAVMAAEWTPRRTQ